MNRLLVWLVLLSFALLLHSVQSNQRVVVNTWGFSSAAAKAFKILNTTDDSFDAVTEGVHVCEAERCDGSVGYGGSPNEENDVTLDAMIMNGRTRQMGAVANLKNIKAPIQVARKVYENTFHSMLVCDEATRFAQKLGFKLENLTTPESDKIWNDWVARGRVPNYWRKQPQELTSKMVGHDTISMVAIESSGHMTCGTSTNSLTFRIPGRIGDSAIPGAGTYCEDGVGGAGATGNGDYIMRFLPSVKAVMYMKIGKLSPKEACKAALEEIWEAVPATEHDKAFAGLVCVNAKGEYGAYAIGEFRDYFKISVQTESMQEPRVIKWDEV